ncbi:CapA family protein [Sandarakinorhabdus sp.]|uniref:CapA family protein n=1 Tax=Sandarakinorhabdus sp. TaxID=1916663 RepID=UPI003F72C56A
MANRRSALKRASLKLLAGTLLCAIMPGVGGVAMAQPALAPVPTKPVADGFTLAAVGDVIYLRPMLATLEKTAPGMLKVLREADVTFGNFETTVLHLDSTKAAPAAESGGTWMLGDPATVGDLAKMGFDIVSHANNHTTDWGVEGLAETLEHLKAGGLVSAGSGRNLSVARAPRYFDAPAGRIALVAASSSFTPMSRASDPLGTVPGRPGLNTLRTERVGEVSAADLAVLARLAGTKDGAPVRFGGMVYEAVNEPKTPMALKYVANTGDVNANLRSVRQAHQNGNFVAFSLHNHEPGNGSQVPAPFAVDFAHKLIDAGADVYIGHGPHQLRGIEIYKGKPIFYSLGNFAMMNNSLDDLPADMYEQFGIDPAATTAPELLQSRGARSFSDPNLYESVIAVSRFVGGKVSEIRLYPIDLGVSVQGAAKGVPTSADAVVGKRILERMQRLSAPFGTRITIENGIGIIRLPTS